MTDYFDVGDMVRLRQERTLDRMGSGDRITLNENELFMVTRVHTNSPTVVIRTVEKHRRPGGWQASDRAQMSFSVYLDELRLDDPNAPRPRRLGEKPEDSDDVPFIYIGPDDPGIQWLFEDMGKFATDKGYCDQYDALCARLGIPGRPREFKVKFKIGDLEASTTVMARSQKEANEQVAKAAENQPTFLSVA